MERTISIRNGESQPKIFPLEMALHSNGLLKCAMGKKPKAKAPEIFLLDWLRFAGIKVTDAADYVGYTQSYISNIGAGRRETVNIAILLELSDLCEITINDFYLPPPPHSARAHLAGYSEKAQATILKRLRRKA